MRRIGVLVLVGVLTACGSDGDGGGGDGVRTDVSTGGVGAGRVTNATAVRARGTCDVATDTVLGTVTVTAEAAVAVLSTVQDACAAIQGGRDPANATGVFVTVFRGGTSTSTTLTPGDYVVSDEPQVDVGTQTGKWAIVDVGESGGPVSGEPVCATEGSASGVSGTVTLTRVSEGAIEGSLNVTLDNGQTVTGSFRAPTCALTTGIDEVSCGLTGLPAVTTCQ